MIRSLVSRVTTMSRSSASTGSLSWQHGSKLARTGSAASISKSFSTSATNPNQAGGALVDKISVIGTGTMASALIEPMISTGRQPASQISVYDVSAPVMKSMHDKFGVNSSQCIYECLEDTNLVLLAVKPQNLNDEFYEMMTKANPKKDAILLSVIAGTQLDMLKRAKIDKVVRSMPNTPATIGKGMTTWCCTSNLTTADRDMISSILESFGEEMYVDQERFIDMSTSISGSGPAYIFLLMESMIDAGVHMGFPRDKATKLVYHTMLGSTLYAIESGEDPALLRNRVTSPSGTTASALYELENGKFRTVIKDAMWACYRRSLEMGNLDSNVGPHRIKTPEHHD